MRQRQILFHTLLAIILNSLRLAPYYCYFMSNRKNGELSFITGERYLPEFGEGRILAATITLGINTFPPDFVSSCGSSLIMHTEKMGRQQEEAVVKFC